MKIRKSLILLSFTFISLIILYTDTGFSKADPKVPEVVESEQGRIIRLPEDVDTFLQTEFPGYKIPEETSFDPELLKYYHSELIGIHPGVTWGDFNQDKKTDFAFLLNIGQSPWGPQIDLVVLNGKKKGEFETFDLGEVYGYKMDYLKGQNGKLYKGKFKRGGWYINWDKKDKKYHIFKS